MLKWMNRSNRSKAVESIIIFVASIVAPDFQEISASKDTSVIQYHQERLNVFGFVRVEGGIEIWPTEELVLVSSEQIRLRCVISNLDPCVEAVEYVISKRDGAIRTRMRDGHIRTKSAARFGARG